MPEGIEIVEDAAPEFDDVAAIQRGLHAFNQEMGGPYDREPVTPPPPPLPPEPPVPPPPPPPPPPEPDRETLQAMLDALDKQIAPFLAARAIIANQLDKLPKGGGRAGGSGGQSNRKKKQPEEIEEGGVMPLRRGNRARSRAGISANIRAERRAGKKQSQAVAIAMRLAL